MKLYNVYHLFLDPGKLGDNTLQPERGFVGENPRPMQDLNNLIQRSLSKKDSFFDDGTYDGVRQRYGVPGRIVEERYPAPKEMIRSQRKLTARQRQMILERLSSFY